MIGLGTIVNTIAIIVGGLLGLLLKNGIAKRFEKILMQALGLATIFIGAGGVFKYMLVMENCTYSGAARGLGDPSYSDLGTKN